MYRGYSQQQQQQQPPPSNQLFGIKPPSNNLIFPQSVSSSMSATAQQHHLQQQQLLQQQQQQSQPPNNSPHFLKQVELSNASRQSNSPHHHARFAIASARQNANQDAASAAAAATTTTISTSNGAINGPGSSTDSSSNTAAALDKPSAWTALDLGGMQIKNLSRDIFKYTFLTTLYLNHNNLTFISGEISKLINLVALDLSGNKLKSIPHEIGHLTSLKDLRLFDNEISVLPPELGFLYQLDTLGLEGNPVNEPISSLLYKDGPVSVIHYLRDSCPVGPPPPEREWISLEEDMTSAANQTDSFTLLCYNTLCDKYATPSTYAYTPSWVLNWDYRKELLLQEMLNYNADVVCLQEVESSQYEEFFVAQLAQHGDYEGIFFPKSRSRTMDEHSRKSVDGCATFWKASKFNLIENQVIEFQQVAMQRPELRKTEDVFNRVMIKDNIAVVCLLEFKDTLSRVIISNAHLHWDPQYKDVKLVQTAMLVEELEKIISKYAALASRYPTHVALAANPSRYPIILCGDFNSLPNSGVYEFLSRATVPQGHEDFGAYKYGPYTTDGLTHKLSLRSAYNHIDELDFTNFTPSFKGVIDYIWYSTNSLIVTGLLANAVTKSVGFPDWHQPSDHIPLVASLRIKQQQTATPTSRAVHFNK